MKKLLFLLALTVCSATVFAQESAKIIKGKVLYLDTPLTNAEITVSGSDKISKTKVNGDYEIEAKPGDILTFTYPSMRHVEIVVEDVTRILNLEMTPEVNQLDEVVVEKTVLKSQKELQAEYATNKNLINTAFGILDKDITSFAVRIIEGSELPLVNPNFASAIRYRFPGIRIDPSGNIYLRGSSLGMFPAILDVDGLVITDTPNFLNVLDIANIERLAVIPGLGAVTKYGGKANGGVIVINTKSGNYFSEPNSEGKPYDQAKLRNNIFENNALSADETANDVAGYLTALRKSTSEQEAAALYNEQIKTYGNSPFYVLDAYDYFSSRWNNKDFADGIIQEHFGQFRDNPLALKALAYHYDVQERFEKAKDVYKEIFILRPNYAQSYADLANSYREVGDYQKSASIYARYGYLLDEGFLRTEGKMFTNIIDRELNNLVSLKGKEILSRKELKNFILDEEFNGTRLVFEWNDSEAEFELQFVNPENQYFKSEHS